MKITKGVHEKDGLGTIFVQNINSMALRVQHAQNYTVFLGNLEAPHVIGCSIQEVLQLLLKKMLSHICETYHQLYECEVNFKPTCIYKSGSQCQPLGVEDSLNMTHIIMYLKRCIMISVGHWPRYSTWANWLTIRSKKLLTCTTNYFNPMDKGSKYQAYNNAY